MKLNKIIKIGCILLLSFIYLIKLSADELSNNNISKRKKIIVASTYLPLEFQFLIQSYQNYPLTKDESQDFLSKIREVDNHFILIPKKNLNIIIKTSIYNGLLNYTENLNKNVSTQAQDNPENSIKTLNKKVNQNYSKYYLFSRWLIESLQSDLWEYNSFKTWDSKNFEKAKLQGDQKRNLDRLKLILPWYHVVVNSTPEELNLLLFPILKKILIDIDIRVYLQAKYSLLKLQKTPKQNSNKKYFLFDQKIVENHNYKNSRNHEELNDSEIKQFNLMKKFEAEKIIDEIDVPETISLAIDDTNNNLNETEENLPSKESSNGQKVQKKIKTVKEDELNWVPKN